MKTTSRGCEIDSEKVIKNLFFWIGANVAMGWEPRDKEQPETDNGWDLGRVGRHVGGVGSGKQGNGAQLFFGCSRVYDKRREVTETESERTTISASLPPSYKK